jgi:DNA-directed RNA polymerase subunit RPC12/RpoP
MADITMIDLPPEDIPESFGTAVQDKPDVPVFKGNGPDSYFCATCGNLLAERMPEAQMKKVRIRCGKCDATNCVELPPPR